ncbi:MAG: Hpt domain-containing protein, partial [Myxococcales bacterium]|nr:Hpt domain-containing protein [Myxococcales bacterium]
MDENDELVQDFLIESLEGLDRLDQEFVELEQDPARRDLLASVFRTIHTIKGTCGFLGFGRLEKVTHVGENLLSRLRDGEIALTAARVDVLLQMVDAVRQMLASIQRSGTDGTEDHAVLITHLAALTDGEALEEEEDDGPEPVTQRVGFEPEPEHEPQAEPEPVWAPEPEPVGVATQPPPPTRSADKQPLATDQTVRVDVRLLERLMDLAGELVLARNQIQQYAVTVGENGFSTVVQHLDLVTTEIQEGVMKTRMQPVGSAWTKLPRLVRDTAALVGKRVRLELDGAETEVDRRLLEAIKDPLTHIVRNAIDHGIESAERRAEARKPAEGLLRLRAWHEGGLVNIEVADDGGGLNLDRVRSKAVERGLISPDAASSLSEAATINLLFQPGFSTAEQVTNVSGRGVGMD